jgi:hypothetical protein
MMFAGRIWRLKLIEPTARSRFGLGCASIGMVSLKITGAFSGFTEGPIRSDSSNSFVLRKKAG